MESSEKVFGNLYLLTRICKYLDFKDQLRLAQVNDQLRNAYAYYSGNVKYSFNYIFRHIVSFKSKCKFPDKIVVAGKLGANGKCLQDPEILVDLLAVYADRAQRDLTLWDVGESLCRAILRKFRNLRSLTIYKTKFTLAMSENLPADLQELNLVDSFPDTKEIVDIIKRMTNLHKVQIACPNHLHKVEHMNLLVLNLTKLPKLECLQFNFFAYNARGVTDLCLQAASNLKELDIMLENVEHFKRLNLQNLKVLHLSLMQSTEHLFSILSESCANLETLTLSSVTFKNITKISLPPKVTELSFHNCKYLRHSCLRQILTEFKIKKFCSRGSHYTGVFYDFQISPHIQSLEIDVVQMTQFRSAFKNNRQLKELIWKIHRNESYDMSFNSTPNLQQLDLPYISPVGSLRQLNSLHSLKLNCVIDRPEWSDIVEILKHPTLHELNIHYTFDNPSGYYSPLGLQEQPVMSLHTNITRLTISPTILTEWLKPWLELFSTNLQMTLVCWPIVMNALSYAKELVNHGNFPRKLKTMDVCCFTIESVKTILGRHTKILVKYMVKLETKNDKTENRVLVFTPVRIYLLIAKVPTKIECHFHYLDIHAVESKRPTHFSIITNDRPYHFATTGDAGNFSTSADVILTDLASAIKHIFPTVPLKYIVRKIDIQPPERESVFSEEYRPADPRNVGPCGGFSTQYACMCDFHGVPYREEVAWDVDTIYMSHDTRILNLRDFDHLEPKDLMAIVSALEYNTFFRGLKASHMRLSNETLERILHVLKRSMWLEELHLEALGLRSDFLHKLAVSVITNNNPAIRTIDLSHNLIEDKGAIHLAGPIAKVSKGLCKLALAHCGLTAKGVNQMSHSLSLNQSISNSLTHLDLSGNNLKDDITNLHNFLAQPNVLEYLDLSSTDITLENLFGALLRGCATHLAHLNVSHNSFSTKKGKEIPPSFKQFFTSSLSLKHLNIAGCKLPMEALKNLLLGLACNESTAGLYLDLSSNTLGAQGAHVLESCIHGVRVLQSLNISDNNLDVELAPVLTAISKNPSIRTLKMCRSLTGMKLKHIPTVMDALVNLIQKDDFPLAELTLSENKLKNDIHDFINALGSNQSLQKLDISGNYMGDIGARLLAKALQINNKLRSLYLDKNSITLQGYADIVYALENNYTVRCIPFPVFDMAPHMKNQAEKTDTIMRKMQDLLQRNGNGLKRTTGQGFRLQHGFMLSSTQQLVDKLVAETQDTISIAKSSNDSTSSSAVQRLIEDAENCKQLMPKLQESVRCEKHPVEVKLTRIASDLSYTIQSYLEETMETMIRTGVEQCPKTLGNQIVIQELRKLLIERLTIPEDFLQSCLLNNAGSEIINKVSEIEQSLAAAISDRATDEVLEALTRYRRGLGIADSPSVMLDEPQTPDIVRSRSSHDTDGIIMRPGRISILPKLGMESPTATPNMPTKRRSVARKVRPQSVVENLSLGHIPDLLESPSSHRSNSQISRRDSSTNGDSTLTSDSRHALDDGGGDECCDSITELPSASFQLQHLVKGRPKRAKTRAPTRPLVAAVENGASIREIGEGLDQFFRPGSVTPTTLTPLVSPTSEECSSLSFVDSPTLSRNGNDHMTSEETTPILEERRPIKLERHSPLLKGAAWATRSRSTDNLEKYSPLVGRKSPLVKMRTEGGGPSNGIANTITTTDSSLPPTPAERLLRSSARDDKMRSPSTDSIKTHAVDTNIFAKTGNGILRTPVVLQKPRPWSVVGSEPKAAQGSNSIHSGSDSTKTTPEKLDEEVEAATFGQGNSDSILPPSSVAGGAAVEKRSVRELAAGLNRLDLPLKPQALPRSLLTSASSSAIPSLHQATTNNSHSTRNTSLTTSLSSSSSSASTSSASSTTITMSSSMNEFNSTKTISSSSTASESKASLSKSLITENGTNEILNIRNMRSSSTSSSATSKLRDFLNNEKQKESDKDKDKDSKYKDVGLSSSSGAATPAVFKRIAGKEISSVFEETLVEGLQQRSTVLRRTLRDTHYTHDDVVDL